METKSEKTERQYFALLSQINNAVTEIELQPISLKVALFDKESQGVKVHDMLAEMLSDNLWAALFRQQKFILLENEEMDCLLNEVNQFSHIKIKTK